LLAVLAEKPDPTGKSRARQRDQGKALAGKSTLNRLELTGEVVSEEERYKKIALDEAAVDRLLVEVFLQAHREPPPEIVLDLDATDDPVHGNQEGRFFHGYYGHYCYLPLYIFCGEQLLGARLRPSNIDVSAGCVEELERIVAQIRAAWPEVRIVVRGEAGFCREELMRCCETHGASITCWGWPRTSGGRRRARRNWSRPRPNTPPRGRRRGSSRSSLIRRGRAGRDPGG